MNARAGAALRLILPLLLHYRCVARKPVVAGLCGFLSNTHRFCLILQPIRDGIVGAWAILGNRPRR